MAKELYRAIFFQRPLKSQKGLIGKCSLDKTKSRCAISHPDFEEQINIVEKTLKDLDSSTKPCIMVFNKIDAYKCIEKAPDDLTPPTKENLTLDVLKNTWMAKLNENCVFISAKEKINMDKLRTMLYNKVRELHVQKYPYNDFLFQKYEEDSL